VITVTDLKNSFFILVDIVPACLYMTIKVTSVACVRSFIVCETTEVECPFIHWILIVRGVRAIKGLFGFDSSKSTKFGTEVDNPIGFAGRQYGALWGRHFVKVQRGRNPVGCKSHI